MGDVAIKQLAAAVTTNTSITSLDLTANMINVEGTAHLAHLLARNTTLRQIFISENPIGLEGFNKIAATLATNCSLQVLQLLDLGFSSEILLRIEIMIDQYKQGMISPLVLSMDGISEKFALQLRTRYLWAGHRHHTVHCSHFRLSSVAHSFYTQHADILTQYLAFLTRFVNRISILHPFCASESSTIARFTKLALLQNSSQYLRCIVVLSFI